MTSRTDCHGLKVADDLLNFVNTEVLPATGINADTFWAGFAKSVAELAPESRALVAKRDDLQRQIDAWLIDHRGADFDAEAYTAFLMDIGYLVP